jgi:asparagine synthase (glutamine-hydrolysing)
MCGICGIVRFREDAREDEIRRMMDAVHHRGPDGGNFALFGHLALGHRRLSILDLSDSAFQPMRYLERYTITYNGEIYNYIELRRELLALGYTFFTDSDTEVLLAAYDRWGEACVDRFNGMWGFCIYDQKKQTLFCSRDRYGVKPFYYTNREGYFAFASEIKQLLLLDDAPPKADRDALTAFLIAAQLDYSERTMFATVRQLEPGTNLLYDLNTNTFSISRWYDLMRVRERKTPFSDSVSAFRERFFDAVRLRLRSDVPVGSCLSGGLDSSAIVCVINRLLRESGEPFEQHVVSACFDEPRYDERPYMDAVLDQTGAISHRTFPDVTRVLDELDDFTWHMDEPITSTSHYAQWCVYREAKQSGLTVMLDGQGADEQLAGYTEFFELMFIEIIRNFRFLQLEREIKLFNERRKTAFYASGPRFVAELVLRAFTPDAIKRLRRKHQAGPIGPYTAEQTKNPEIASFRNGFDFKHPRRFIYAQIYRTLAVLLHYGDRNSMAFSIESRLPFLDYRLVETLFSMPLSHKIRYGLTKRVMREAMRGVMPDLITDRQSKLGFTTPEEDWMRKNPELFHTMLESAVLRLSPRVQAERTLAWYDELVRTDRFRECHVIWRIISAARWADIFHVEI